MKDEYQGKDQKKYHFLFILSAKKGIVTEICNNYSILLTGLDHKVLFMTARPGRTRAFIPVKQFIQRWLENNKIFLEHPPRIAMIDSGMKVDAHGIAKAIEIELSNPNEQKENSWQFDLKFLSKQKDPGTYHHLTLMIDWPAALVCPEPIRIQVPSLISES